MSLAGRPACGSADELKRQFATLVNGNALDARNYAESFSHDALINGRRIEATLHELLGLLRQ